MQLITVIYEYDIRTLGILTLLLRPKPYTNLQNKMMTALIRFSNRAS